MKVLGFTFLGVVLLYIPLLYTLINRKIRRFYVPVKMVNSTFFIVTAFLIAFNIGSKSRLIALLPAFLLCFLGDLFMGIHNKNRKQVFLLLGALLFFSAHISFLIYLYRIKPFSLFDLIGPVAGILGVLFISSRKVYSLGKFLYPAFIYAMAVSSLFVKSAINYLAIPNNNNLFFCIGGLLFVISDTLILVMYFRKRRGWSVHGWNLATYYAAMWFIAASI